MRALIGQSADCDADYGTYGRHLLLTLTGCPSQALDDLAGLENLVRRAAAATGAS
ncbi:MAG: hypothetical protein HGA65_14350, partial [Oscillochloris sp.]|nr:hypothetical protein [Oscillochloris sp.]